MEKSIVIFDNCKKEIEYIDSDVKSNYISSPSDVLDGFDFYSKWIICPHCSHQIDLN